MNELNADSESTKLYLKHKYNHIHPSNNSIMTISSASTSSQHLLLLLEDSSCCNGCEDGSVRSATTSAELIEDENEDEDDKLLESFFQRLNESTIVDIPSETFQSSYHRQLYHHDNNDNPATTTMSSTTQPNAMTPKQILNNYILFCILFSANHGCVVSCLSVATARLGNELGSYQSIVLYFTYTITAMILSTYVVKTIGSRNALGLGMLVYCFYIGCFIIATITTSSTTASSKISATSSTMIMTSTTASLFWRRIENTIFPIREISTIIGAVLGGIGGGILWTAQGSYFTRVSEEYAIMKQISIHVSTSYLGSIFATIFLLEEVVMRFVSTMVIEIWSYDDDHSILKHDYLGSSSSSNSSSWVLVFSIYTIIAILSTFGMVCIHNYPKTIHEQRKDDTTSALFKATETLRVLIYDPKMKYMIPLSAIFSLSAAFVVTFVNGQVLPIALSDSDFRYLGAFTSITPAVAAISSIIFGCISSPQWYRRCCNDYQRHESNEFEYHHHHCFHPILTRNGLILIVGCVSFFTPAFLFVIFPNLTTWKLGSILCIYVFQGIGRATFEGTLRAEFALIFHDTKEGAFGNIVLFNGIASSIGFFLSTKLECDVVSTYCVEFLDGSLHNVLYFELWICTFAILAVLSYWRGSHLYNLELEVADRESSLLAIDDSMLL